ncbi:nascent polypeptide-associated complex subunit alpha, muscle-specific form isoform X2 [Bactrocera oleae]|uniref:nascent polypeptide-associated complex subunit alpha, muscle-specific form isoform X2 n=1 Tax=Bactrocera oleae TaxID=104688 RepID=UPI00387EAC97
MQATEPKPLVTIGSATDVDNESLDEINLNTTIEETQSSTNPSSIAGNIDPNANPLWSDVNNPPTDSILSQAASSFSALPSVASSVLSTFSKRISEYSASNSRERTPTSDNGNLAPQLDIQPAYLQQQFQTQPQQEQQQQYPYYNIAAPLAPPPVGADPASVAATPYTSAVSSAAPPPAAPKFYTPIEVPTLPTAGAANLPPPGGQNTYRLAAKKKLYAPIPGFSEHSSGVGAPAPAIPTSSTAPPLQGIPPLPPQPAVPTDPLGNPLQAYPYEPNYEQTESHALKQEERKTGGLFSNISSLVPSGVLQNISGLVQSATGTFAQGTNKLEESIQQPHYGNSGAYQQSLVEPANVDAAQYFGVSVVAPPAPQFYPPPVEGNQLAAPFFAPPQQSPLSSQQQQQEDNSAQIQAPAAPTTSQLFAPPAVASVQAVPPPPPTAGFISGPPKSATPDYSKQRPSASTTTHTFFDPTKQPSTPASFFGVPQQPTVNPTPVASTDNSNLLSRPAPPANIAAPPSAASVPSVAVPTFDSTQEVSTQFQPPSLFEPPSQLNLTPTPAQLFQPPTSTGIPLFQQGTVGLNIPTQVPTLSTAVNFTPPQSVGTLPPPAASPSVSNNQTPLPPTAGGTTSFRLQKGTRLYKSPLTSAETAPVQIPTDIAQPLAPPTNFYNPFGSTAPVGAPNPVAPPPVPSVVPSYFIAQPAESIVGLFAVDKAEPIPNKDVIIPESQPFCANVNANQVKAEEPQSFPAPTSVVDKIPESSIAQSLTADDLGAIIQQQTIEPEILASNDLETEDHFAPLEPPSLTKKQGESLHETIDHLSLSDPPQEKNKEQDFQLPQSVPASIEKGTSESAEESSLFNQQTFHSDYPHTVEPNLSEPQKSQIQQETQFKTSAAIEELPTAVNKPENSVQKSFLESQDQQFELTPVKETELQTASLPFQEPHLTKQQISLPPPTSTQPQAVNPLLPPNLPDVTRPPTQNQNSNPFRKNVGASPFASIAQPHNETQPKLANFFADALGVAGSGTAEFNIFTPSQQPPLVGTAESQPSFIPTADPVQTSVAPAIIPASAASAAVPSTAGFFGFVEPTQTNFFQPVPAQQTTEFPSLPPLSGIAPPPLACEASSASEAIPQTPLGIPPPIGFDNILPPNPFVSTQSANQIPTAPPLASSNIDTVSVATTSVATDVQASPFTGDNTETQHSEIVNSFSNYFYQTANLTIDSKQIQAEQQQQQLPQIAQPAANVPPLADTSSSSANFFDTFAPQPQPTQLPTATDGNLLATQQHTITQSNEDQRLQNFFNNPPQRENNAGVGDLGYDLVHSGLAVRHLGSVTSVSNLVEPPSSSCSEFSELNNSNPSARILPAELQIRRNPEKSIIFAETQQEVLSIAAEIKQEVPAAAESTKIVDTPLESTVANSVSEVPLEKHYEDLPEEILRELRMANLLTGEKAAASAPPVAVPYSPAVKHWFYKRPAGNNKFVWTPFSHYDSALLEITLTMGSNAPNIVAVEGGRYDVNISERTKTPVYWESTPIEVRRCSWFFKGTDSKMVPYEESIADLLENEYKQAVESGEWHKKIVLSMNEQVTFHGPTVIVHFQQQQSSDAWGGTTQTTTRPRVVKRDLEEFSIEQGESQRVDHLLLMVHGIGDACDLKLRSVDEVVDDFRNIAQALVQSHYKNSTEMGLVGRVEVLPISWHNHLHSEEMGIDEKLRSITLESIPKLRNFTNNTLLDVLFYTSPKYCQKIMNTVAASMNEVYSKYRERHPDFNGGVSLAGHSLGSLILFDLLCHQKAPKESEERNLENPDQLGGSPMDVSNDDVSVTSYTMGPAGTGQPFIHYTQLNFQPKKFFALGSPIGMFVTIRGIDKLGVDFRLPTCSGFYNIFHPFDPVAYRIEALVNPDLSGVRPVLIPHHKGRKRMHLELKETMTRVGADLKQRFLDTFKNTLESVSFLGGSSGRSSREAEESMSKEVDKVLNMQIDAEKHKKSISSEDQPGSSQGNTDASRTRSDSVSTSHSDSEMVEIDFPLGKLNDSKRIDYVLQEAPLEFINEYIFALGAHVCYWESEDTILFVMKEIYTGLGISPDNQVPQQTMTIERPSSRNSNPLSSISEKR